MNLLSYQFICTLQELSSDDNLHKHICQCAGFLRFNLQFNFKYEYVYCQTCGFCRGGPANPAVFDRKLLYPVSIATHTDESQMGGTITGNMQCYS